MILENYHYTQTEEKELLKNIVVVCDTREQKNSHITDYFNSKSIPWVSTKLNYGDYSYCLRKNESLGIPRDLWFDREICIERKANLDEFAGNVTKERDRIKKELTLAPVNKLILIENASYEDMILGNYRSQYAAKSYYGTVHSFWHEFNVPFIFMKDPKYSGYFIYGHFCYHLRNMIK